MRNSCSPVLARRHRKPLSLKRRSSAPAAKQVKKKRQNKAKKNRSREGKIERGVLSTVNDVAGEASHEQVGASQEREEQPRDDENDADEDQRFAEIRHCGLRNITVSGDKRTLSHFASFKLKALLLRS